MISLASNVVGLLDGEGDRASDDFSAPSRAHDLEAERLRAGRLGGVGGHEAPQSQFLHGREVKPIERSPVDPARLAILAQRRLKQRASQRSKTERVGVAKHVQAADVGSVPPFAILPREPARRA